MFQMKFYAVALLRSRGVLPARLRLLYLSDGQVLDYTPISTSSCGSRRR
jgi:putative RecB family exonuclease